MDKAKFISTQLPKLARTCFKTLKAYTPGEQPQNIQEWIKLNTNENPSEPIEPVVNALKDAITKRLRMYPDPNAQELRAAIAKNFLSRYNSLKSPDDILVSNGSDETLDTLFKTFVDPGDGVVYFNPSYGMYSVLTDTYNGISHVYPLNEKNFSIGPFEPQPIDKLLIICSPNNPDGNSVPLGTIEKVCHKFPGIVFVDEAYGDFADSSALTLLAKYPNLVVGRTYSKSASMASARLGFAIADPAIIRLFDTVRLPYNVSFLTQVAGIAVMHNWDLIVQRSEAIKAERARVIAALKGYGYDILPTQANFYLIRLKSEKDAAAVYNGLKQQKILVRYWSKPGLAQYMRVTVGSREQNDIFLAAMQKFTQ